MASTVIRHLVGLLGWACLFGVAVALALWTIVEHYLSVKSALELVGFEQQEMWRDPLVGRVLGAFMPEATLAQAVALTIAVTEALVLVIAFEVMTRIGRLLHHRRAMRDLGNDAEAREAVVQACERLALLAVLGAALVVALRYDFELFRLRAVAGSLGMELPEEVSRLQGWGALASDPDRPYAVTLAHIGAWGYMAFTMLGCFALHYCPGKVGEHFSKLMAPIDEWLDGERGGGGGAYDEEHVDDEEVDDFVDEDVIDDEAEGPVDAIRVPELPEEPAAVQRSHRGREASAGAPGGHDPGSLASEVAAQGGSLFPPLTPPSREGGASQATSAGARSAGGSGAVGMTQQEASSSQERSDSTGGAAAGRSSGRRPTGEARLPVIGGAAGESMTLAAARRDPERYFIDPETGRIWRSAYWDALHGTPKDDGLRQEER